jgi:hypothetical protein
MSDRLLRRLGAVSGIIYVVLGILGSDVLGGSETGVGIIVELLSFAFFPFFLGSLWVCLRSAERDGGWLSATAFGGGLVALAVKLGSAGPILAVRASEGMDPGIAKALVAMNDASFGITWLPLTVMLSGYSDRGGPDGCAPKVARLGGRGGGARPAQRTVGRSPRSLTPRVGVPTDAAVPAVDHGGEHCSDPARGQALPHRNVRSVW